MAFMRGNPYIYQNINGTVEFFYNGEHLSLPTAIVEEFCAMFWSRITPEEQEKIEHRAYAKYAGNFGVDGLAVKHGLPSTMDTVSSYVKRLEDEKEES